MTMKVAFIKDTPDYPAGWNGFVSRQLGRTLCYQNIAIPDFGKEKDERYIAIIRAKKKAEREAKEKAERLDLKKQKKTNRKRAVSVKAETREKAVNT